MRSIVVVDIGSTTTKAVLFRENGGGLNSGLNSGVQTGWSFVRREAPTTVEAPHEDVTIGLLAALRSLEEAAGERLMDGEAPAIPLLLTSSAGGGLAMVVTGLVREVTSRSAERAALGAGALVLDVVALNDGRVPYRKIEALERLRPDMVLFAGGFDGDAISGPVFLAELLRQAGLRPKLSDDARLPVVYAGNANAAGFVRETLGDESMLHVVDNLRPASDRESLEGARSAIHELFMEHVMSHAPGYGKLRDWVEAPIRPTPSSVAGILETVTATSDERILAIDIGGATTDVFTAAGGHVFRTVSANLGMSYSALHVAASGGIETIREVLGSSMDETEIWNRVGEKHLCPTRLPPTSEDVRVEWALATAAVRQAVRDHLEVLSGARLSRGDEQLSLRSIGRRARRRRADTGPFPLEGYDLVLGSGGALSHVPRTAAATILANALEPRGPVALAVDRAFILPHLGAVANVEPDLARTLFRDLALVSLGTLVAPVTKSREDGVLTIETDGRSTRIRVGDLHRMETEEARETTLRLRGQRLKVDRKEVDARGGVLGILVDARPRPLEDRTATLVTGEVRPPVDDRPPMAPAERIRRGILRERRELAIVGTVLVEAGDTVEPETTIARSRRVFPRPFFCDAAGALGVPADQVGALLRKGPGDEVETGEVLAEHRPGGLREIRRFESPTAGTIERLLPDGTVILRERPEIAEGLAAVQAARDLGVSPSRLHHYLRVEPGQEIERDQAVALLLDSAGTRSSRSPVRGTVKAIDEAHGIVHVVPLREELEVSAWLPGQVVEITDRGAVVEAPGLHAAGVWGVGREVAATLVVDRIEAGAVVALTRPRAGVLADLATAGVAGCVTGGLDLAEIRAADPAFPLVLIEGFGVRAIPDDLVGPLREHEGRRALLDATTELRVGVRRPRIILPDQRLRLSSQDQRLRLISRDRG